MATPSWGQYMNLTAANAGLVPQELEARLLSVMAVIASGQNPDGTLAPTAVSPNPGIPTVTALSGATSATLVTGSTNQRGKVSVVLTGTDPSGSPLFNLAFSTPLVAVPVVLLTVDAGAIADTSTVVPLGFTFGKTAGGFSVQAPDITLTTGTFEYDYYVVPFPT
jgi:hypothetical protein